MHQHNVSLLVHARNCFKEQLVGVRICLTHAPRIPELKRIRDGDGSGVKHNFVEIRIKKEENVNLFTFNTSSK